VDLVDFIGEQEEKIQQIEDRQKENTEKVLAGNAV